MRPVETFRRYGVTHLVLRAGEPPQPVALECCAIRPPALDSPLVRILSVDHPDPLAFPSRDAGVSLPVTVFPARVDVNVQGFAGGEVTVNYLWRTGSRVRAGDKLLPARADRWGRILVDVPPESRLLSLPYESPWKLGLLVGGLLCLAGLAMHFLLTS